MKRKKLATMLVVAFAISATSVAPVVGADDDISKYDCDYKPYLDMTAGVSSLLATAWSSETDFTTYWTTTKVNVRTQPTTGSEIVDTLPFNQVISVAKFNSEWSMIYWNEKIYYINNKYIQNNEVEFELFEVPYAANKTWMPYTAITSKSSPQYKLQHSVAYTGNYGIRMVNGRYCVALGSHFGCEIGDIFDLILENGTVIPCIMGDQKADNHTDSANIITVATDCLSEFIVDKSTLDFKAKKSGDVSSICAEWDSPVVQIKVYKEEK